MKLQIALLALLALLDFFCLILGPGRLHQEQEADSLRVDAVHQFIKEYECLFLELYQRILLAVAAQPDPFFQVIERKQVVFPLPVHHVEQYVAFQPAQRLRAEKNFLFFVSCFHLFDHRFRERVVIQRSEIQARRFRVEAKLIEHLVAELRDVPLVRMLLARAVRFNQLVSNCFGALQNKILLIAPFQKRTAQPVNGLALFVHHIVVLQQMFARFKVLRFHRLLRVFDPAAD